MVSHNYSDLTIKKLYSLHGNKCAFLGCVQELITTDKRINVSDICHIEGKDEESPRYNPNLSTAQLDDYENLILMCKIHHKIIDTDLTTYTVSYLKKLKNEHEKQQQGKEYQISDEMVHKIIAEQMMQINVNSGSGIQNVTHIENIIQSGTSSISETEKLFDTLFEKKLPKLREEAQKVHQNKKIESEVTNKDNNSIMRKKKKGPIPKDIAAKILFLADRKCCVCRNERVQIHYLDNDPSNFDMDNLAVLCIDCYTETQVSGGLHRKLDEAQIRLYRNDWNYAVAKKRNENFESLSLQKIESLLANFSTTMKKEILSNEKNNQLIIDNETGTKSDNVFSKTVDTILMHLQNGEYVKADVILDNVLQNNDKNTIFLTLRGLSYAEQDQYEKSLDFYDKALQIDENSVIILVFKSESLLQMQRYDDAFSLLNKSLRLEPQNTSVLFYMGRFYQLTDNLDEAILYYDKVLTIDPTDVESLINKGEIFIQKHDYVNAYSCFDNILRNDPNDVFALYNKGYVLDNMEKYDESITCYEKILKMDPKHTGALTFEGVALSRLGKYRDALSKFDKVFEIESTSVPDLLHQARAYRELGDFEKVIEYLNKVLKIDPKNESALFNKASTYLNLDQYEDAMNSFDEMIKYYPKNTESIIRKGHALLALHRFDEAKKTFQTVITKDPYNSHAHYHMGQTDLYLGNTIEALKSFDKVSKKDKGYSGALYYKAKIACFQHDDDYAINLLAQALGIDSSLKKQIREDEDFDKLSTDQRYLRLIN